jgi:hypothetical protein
VHTLDVVLACAVVVTIALLTAVLARQRYMLRVGGGQPVAVQVRGNRWIYGIGRYAGSELRWYRAIGFGTRPTRSLDRGELTLLRRRAPTAAELNALPATAVIVECRYGDGGATLAFGESGFTGFISWLEASSPTS